MIADLLEIAKPFVGKDKEKKVLAKYVGWGGLAQAFDEHNLAWQNEYKELKDVLDDEEYAGLMLFAKKVAKAIGQTIECKRVAVAVLGLEVPHAHIHLIPIQSEKDMDFFREKLSLPAQEMNDIAARISAAVE